MIKIRSFRNGFRRCGLVHSDKEVVHPNDRFTEKELAILQAEPMLHVEVIGGGELEDDDKKPSKTTKKPPANSE